jgi:ankyrin repeat protein
MSGPKRKACSVAALVVIAAGCLLLSGLRQKQGDMIGDIPVRVLWEHKGFGTWFVEIAIDKAHYSRENLEQIWRFYCEKYPDTKDKLDVRVYASLGRWRGHDPDALFSRQAEGLLASGGDNEFYTYRPDPDMPNDKQNVQLRGRYPFLLDAYTGDPGSDLVVAAGKGDLVKFEELLKQGVDPSSRDHKGRTALMAACRHNNLGIVKTLMARAADLDARDVDGETALVDAVMAIVKDPNEGDGWRWGNPQTVRFLLDHGASVNVQKTGWTPLMCAASNGKDDILRMLLDKGADVNVRTETGMSVLTRAIYDGRLKLPSIKLLIEAGADLNSKDGDGLTPLMLAVRRSQSPDLVRLLINCGADLNATNNAGETALVIARRTADRDSARIQDCGTQCAEVAREDYRHDCAIIEMLLRAGAEK